MDRLAWNINYHTSRLGQAPRQSDSVISFSDEVPVSQGQWGQATVPVDEVFAVDLYDAGGAGHLIVSSNQLLEIQVNTNPIYGSHLVVGMAEVSELTIKPLGLPVDQGEMTGVVSPTGLEDSTKQWKIGRTRGNLATGTEWCDLEHSLDFILDVNGRLGRILLDAPIVWGKGEDDGTGDAVAGYLNKLVDDSVVGEGQVAFEWVDDHFEIENLQGTGSPIVRPYLDNIVHWLARLGLYQSEYRPSLLDPTGMRLRITSGEELANNRVVESATEHSLEWSVVLHDLVAGDSYRILKIDEEAKIEWLVVDRGTR